MNKPAKKEEIADLVSSLIGGYLDSDYGPKDKRDHIDVDGMSEDLASELLRKNDAEKLN